MSKEDNEWGIEEIEHKDDHLGDSSSYFDQMPNKEVTADLTNAMTMEVIEEAMKNGIPEDEDISVDVSEFDGNSENDRESAYEEDSEYDDEVVYNEDSSYNKKSKVKNGKPTNNRPAGAKDVIDELEEEDDNSKVLTIASIVVLVLIVIVGAIFLISQFGKKQDSRDEYIDEEDDYIIEDIYGRDDNDSSDSQVVVKPEENKPEESKPEESKPSNAGQNQCASGHDYSEATCTKPQTCTRCGETKGEPLGHDFSEATCLEGAVCSRCGAKGTEALSHNYTPATCTEPRTCSRCGATEGEALGHDFAEATCTKPSTCTRCGTTQGSALDHKYQETGNTTEGATQTITYTCSVCGDVKTETRTVAVTGSLPEQVINLVNADRAANGLAPLSSTPELMAAAQARAVEISSAFSHTRPDGSSCFTIFPEYGVAYNTAGENIAAGQSSASEVETGWMNSPGHRSNILSAGFGHIGVGYYNSGSGYSHYWVQMFTN